MFAQDTKVLPLHSAVVDFIENGLKRWLNVLLFDDGGK